MASYAPEPAHDGKVESTISCKYPLLWCIECDLIKQRSETNVHRALFRTSVTTGFFLTYDMLTLAGTA